MTPRPLRRDPAQDALRDLQSLVHHIRDRGRDRFGQDVGMPVQARATTAEIAHREACAVVLEAVGKADSVVAPTAAFLDAFLDCYPETAAAGRTRVIHNGIDTHTYRPEPNEDTLRKHGIFAAESPERLARRELDRLSAGIYHQGALCWAPELELVDFESLCARASPLGLLPEQIDPVEWGGAAHALDRRQRKAAAKHRQPMKQRACGRGQELFAPAEHGAYRAVPLGGRAVAAAKRQTVAEPSGDVAQGQHTDPGSSSHDNLGLLALLSRGTAARPGGRVQLDSSSRRTGPPEQ